MNISLYNWYDYNFHLCCSYYSLIQRLFSVFRCLLFGAGSSMSVQSISINMLSAVVHYNFIHNDWKCILSAATDNKPQPLDLAELKLQTRITAQRCFKYFVINYALVFIVGFVFFSASVDNWVMVMVLMMYEENISGSV